MYDIRKVRRDFPILDRRVGESKLVYLDNAATSQKPRQVLDTLNDYYEEHNANIHRGVHRLAEEATALYEGSRERVARFLGAGRKGPDLHPRHDRIHKPCGPRLGPQEPARRRRDLAHRGRAPLQPRTLAASGARDRREAALHPIREDGTLDMEVASRLIGPRTQMVGCIHSSNVLAPSTRSRGWRSWRIASKR